LRISASLMKVSLASSLDEVIDYGTAVALLTQGEVEALGHLGAPLHSRMSMPSYHLGFEQLWCVIKGSVVSLKETHLGVAVVVSAM